MEAFTPSGWPSDGVSFSFGWTFPFKSYTLDDLGANSVGRSAGIFVGVSGLTAVTFPPPSIFQPFKALWWLASSAVISFSFHL